MYHAWVNPPIVLSRAVTHVRCLVRTTSGLNKHTHTHTHTPRKENLLIIKIRD